MRSGDSAALDFAVAMIEGNSMRVPSASEMSSCRNLGSKDAFPENPGVFAMDGWPDRSFAWPAGLAFEPIAAAETWRDLTVAPEQRCSPYDRKRDYPYPQSIEHDLVRELGAVYGPNTRSRSRYRLAFR